MYKTGLTQENSVYDLSLLGDTNNNTGATDFSNMSDEEILKAFEEKQNSENADNKDNTETLSDTKTETTENTTDKTDKVADLDKDAKVDADKSEETASDNALYQITPYIIGKKISQKFPKMNQKLIATQIQRQKQNRTQALSITTKNQPQMITQKLM